MEARWHQIRVRDGRLEEWDGGSIAVSIPLTEVRRVRIVHGRTADRPLVQAAIGVAMIAVGVFFVIRLARWVAAGGNIVDVEVLMVGWLVGGPWILAGALRRGVVLVVETGRETRRLIVGRGATGEDGRRLAEDLRRHHGLAVVD
jgi:hypothetical protein